MSETGRVYRLRSNSVIGPDRFFDTAVASEMVLGSIEHFAEAQGQLRVNFMDDNAQLSSVGMQASTGGDLFVPIQSFRIRMAKRTDGRPFGLFVEMNLDPGGKTGDVWVTLTEGWEATPNPYDVGPESRGIKNLTVAGWTLLDTPSSSLLYFPRTIPDVTISPVRRGLTEPTAFAAELCAATVTVWARKTNQARDVQLKGMICREYHEIGE